MDIDVLGKLALAFQKASSPIKLLTVIWFVLTISLAIYYLANVAKPAKEEPKGDQSPPTVSIQGDSDQINIAGRDVIVQQQVGDQMTTKIDDIHRVVKKVDREVQQLGTDIESVQQSLITQVEFTSSGCRRFSRNKLPEEIQQDLRSGRLFYERHLNRAFPELPDEIFVEVVSVRATPLAANAVYVEFVTERPLLAVFWAYKGYGTVRHARAFEPPRYTIGVAPLLSQKWMKVYFIDAAKFESPTVDVGEWKQ